jgi:hypothetical protein
MVDILTHGALFDSASARLRSALEALEGVSPETLDRLDFISHPRTDCPQPQDDERTAVFTRLVLLGLAEAALDRQAKSTKKTKSASPA